MSKILSFKSSLRFSSWVVLASFLSVPLSHAMDNEEENKKPSPLLPVNMVQYIAGFVTDPKDQGSMALVNNTWNRGMKKKSQKVYESIQEKMKEFDGGDQELIRSVLGKEVDCDKHTHFNVLKFMDCFKEDPKKYKGLYQQLLKYPKLSKFHQRTMIINAAEFGLLEYPELIQIYEIFSIKQMDILGKYGEFLIPKFSNACYYSSCLKALQPFSIEQMDILEKYREFLIPKRLNGYYNSCLKVLLPFSIKQMDILGKYGEFLIPKRLTGYNHNCCLEALYSLSIEQLEILGKYSASIFPTMLNNHLETLQHFSVKQMEILEKYGESILPKMSNNHLKTLQHFSVKRMEILGKYGGSLFPKMSDYSYSDYLITLKSFSIKQFDVLGRNAETIFQNVEGRRYAEFIKKNLKNLTPEEIELFAQEKEKKNNEKK